MVMGIYIYSSRLKSNPTLSLSLLLLLPGVFPRFSSFLFGDSFLAGLLFERGALRQVSVVVTMRDWSGVFVCDG